MLFLRVLQLWLRLYIRVASSWWYLRLEWVFLTLSRAMEIVCYAKASWRSSLREDLSGGAGTGA